MHSHTSIPLVLVFCGIMILTGSCNESLPPYENPSNYLQGSILETYVLAHQNNYMGVHVRIANVFDETLDGEVHLDGQLRIRSVTDPSIVKTVSLTALNLTRAKHYDAASSRLTIDPGDTVQLSYAWDFIDDNGRDLRTSFFRFFADTTCPYRCLAYTEDFRLSGQVTVFSGRPSVQLKESTFSLCYVNFHVNPAYCPPILFGAPCNYYPMPGDQPCTP